MIAHQITLFELPRHTINVVPSTPHPFLLRFIARGRSCFIVSRTLIVLWPPLPHPQFLPLCLCFRLSVFLLELPELSPHLSLIDRSHACPKHLLSYIPAE